MGTFILFLLVLIPAIALLLMQALSGKQEMSGPARVASHRVAQRAEMPKEDARYVGNWNYLVTFTLSDGEKIELYTTQRDFQRLTDGTCGWLTWQGKQYHSFVPEEENGRSFYG